jgi:hypothetical protein
VCVCVCVCVCVASRLRDEMEQMRINFTVTARHDRHKTVAAQGMQTFDAFVPNILLMLYLIYY